MKTGSKTQLWILVFLIALLAGCASSKVTEPNYSGEWHYTFPTMDGGEMAAVMTLKKEEGSYSGFLSSEMGSVDLNDLEIVENSLKANFTIQSYTIDLTGTFDGDLFHGVTAVEGMEMPMEATRQL